MSSSPKSLRRPQKLKREVEAYAISNKGKRMLRKLARMADSERENGGL